MMAKQTKAACEEKQQLARMAIAELFLDTELDDATFDRLRGQLIQSGLSITELDEIYFVEIAPLLYRNLQTPAGAWSGFDPEWIQKEALQRREQSTWTIRIPVLDRLMRLWVTRTTINDWRRLRSMLPPTTF